MKASRSAFIVSGCVVGMSFGSAVVTVGIVLPFTERRETEADEPGFVLTWARYAALGALTRGLAQAAAAARGLCSSQIEPY